MAGDLYHRDFYLWTQTHAQALRNRSANALDYDLLAEEVGDMGRRDARECASRVRTILDHLMKLAASQRVEPKAGWRSTVLTQRFELVRTVATTNRVLLEADLARLHEEARQLAQACFATREPGAPPLDASLQWSLKEILGEENDPIA